MNMAIWQKGKKRTQMFREKLGKSIKTGTESIQITLDISLLSDVWLLVHEWFLFIFLDSPDCCIGDALCLYNISEWVSVSS